MSPFTDLTQSLNYSKLNYHYSPALVLTLNNDKYKGNYHTAITWNTNTHPIKQFTEPHMINQNIGTGHQTSTQHHYSPDLCAQLKRNPQTRNSPTARTYSNARQRVSCPASLRPSQLYGLSEGASPTCHSLRELSRPKSLSPSR